MSNALVLGVVIAAACATTIEEDPKAFAEGETILEYTLRAEEERYVAGEPVTIGFSLHNVSDEPLYVLRWYTPLEGIAGDIFRVEHEGRKVEFRGPMVRRAEPGADDYELIEPGQAVSAEVDLRRAYDLSAPGEYQVDFLGRIHDVVSAEAVVPRGKQQHRAMTASGTWITLSVGEK